LPTSYAGLIDTHTGALLLLSPEPPIIAFLYKAMPATRPEWSVNFPNYLAEPVPLAGMTAPATAPHWTWHRVGRRFEPTAKTLLGQRLLWAAALARKKADALSELNAIIGNARNLLWSGVLLQETVNLTKRWQALAFRAAGYPEHDLLGYPYVLQYAEVTGLPMKTAADEILFRAELDDEILAKTEAIRLKYLDRLRTADYDATVDALMVAFRTEIFGEIL
jgi:hypothetical protein